MSLKLHSVTNASTPDNEFVMMQAIGATNLGGYAIIDRTFNHATQLSNEFRHIFMFPNMQVADGDFIFLFTGKGAYKKVKRENATDYMHYFYWGSGTCVWNNNGGDTASLIEIKLVSSVGVPAVK